MMALVSVFANGAFNDVSADGEVNQVIQSLSAAGHTVRTFSGTSFVDYANAVDDEQALVIPELELGNLAVNPDPLANLVLQSYVAQGGGLIIFGSNANNNELALLSLVFGINVTPGTDDTGATDTRTTAANATQFASGPATISEPNSTSRLVTSSLPASARSIYAEGANTTVALFRFGHGQIVYLGYDWFSALPPPGSQDGGWNAVLDRAVDQVTSLWYESTTTQNLVLRRFDSNGIEIADQTSGAILVRKRISETNNILVSGADNLNTNLLVDYNFGGFVDRPAMFRGGAGATDRLTVVGGNFANTAHTINGALDGTITHAGVPVAYTGVELVDDVTDGENYTLTATTSADAAVVDDGPTVLGNTTARFRSTNGTFGNIHVSRKRFVTFDASAGADTITVNLSGDIDRLLQMTINSGATSGDVVNVLNWTDRRLNLTSSAGSDTVNIGNSGVTSGILGEINIANPPDFTAVRIDASAETAAKLVRVRENEVQGLTPRPVFYVENDISTLTLLSGSGADDIRVESTAANKTTSISTGSGNDVFLVEAPQLGPGGTLILDGQAGTDTLTMRGAGITNVTHTVTGPASGQFLHDGRPTNYAGIETAQDVTTATNYTLLGTADADVVNVINGPTVEGASTTQFSATNGTFGTVNVGRKTNITYNSGAGADTINVNNPGGATGLTALTVNSGGTDGDVVNVLSTRDGVSTTITNSGGTDVVNVGNNGLLTGILGALSVSGASNLTALGINAIGDGTARTVSVTNASVAGLAPVTIGYSGDAISSLTVQMGSGADIIGVTGTAANRTTTIRSGAGNDTFSINADGLGANSTNNFAGEGGDDTFTSSFSVSAIINVDGGPHIIGDRMRYDFAGLGVVLLANSVAAAGRLPINVTNIEFQDLIGLGTDIPSVNVRHSPLGGISKIFTTDNAHNAVIQVQGGATYSLFNLRANVPIAVDGSFLDDRLEIINTGTVLLDAEITFKGAQNSSFGDSLALSGGGNLVVSEIHSATGPNAGVFNLDNVMTVDYSAIEALTDSMLTFGLTYNTPPNQADQLAYGDGGVIPESHRITSGNNAFLAYEFASKVEVTVNTGAGGADGADLVSVGTTIDMPLMTVLRVSTGAGDDRVTINATSPLPLFAADLGAGAADRLIVLAGDTPNELTITASAVNGLTTPITYNNTVEELEVFGQGGDDTFNVTPSAVTRYIIHGDAQDVADTLKIDAQVNSVTVAEGSVTAVGRRPIDFDGIEAGELFSSTVQIVVLTMLHDAGGGASTVHTGDTANSGTLQVQDGPVFEFRDLIPTAILFFQGGAGDDRLNFVHDGQTLLNVFLDYVGGGHVTGDVLAFSGNQPPLANETHQPSGPNSGTITFGPTLTARYATLENIEDALPVTQLNWVAPNNTADNVIYENGVFLPTAHQIRSGNAAFVTHQFTAKTDIDVRLDSGAADLADLLDVLVTQAMPGLASLEFFAGAGPDSAAITITAALPPTVYHAGSGILDFLTVRGTAGDDALTVEATKISGAGTSVTYDNEVENLRVEAGDGNDAINVLSISATIVTVVAGGAGNDTATVQAPLAAVLTFQDGDGDDRLILVGTDADETFNLGGTTVTGAGATINYSATLEHLDARGLGGLDKFFVSPNEVTEYFVDGGPPTGVLPGDRLEINFTGTTGRRLTFTGPGAGAWTFTNRKRVGFTDIEEFNFFDLLAAGADAGATSAPGVLLIDALSLEESVRLLAYEAGYKEGVRVALGDLNGDGIPELVTAPGRSRAPEIRVFDVTSGAELTQYRFQAFDAGFVGGVYVAVGDVDGDGRNDIVASVGRGPSEVRVYRNNIIANPSAPFGGAPYRKFSPFGDQFIGGASVAAADFTGDGKADVVVGSGSGMRATVRVYDVSANASSYTPLQQVLPFDAAFRGGVFVAAGRINGDGVPDIIASQGPSGDARVELFDGRSGATLANFDGYADASSSAPIRAVGADLDGDGQIERVITSQGPDGRNNLIRRFTTSGALVDQVWEDESQFLNGFHLASFFANANVLKADAQAIPTAADIVTKLYQQVLGRAPEPAGLDYWVAKINAGESYGTIASGIFESAERLDPIIRQYYRDYLLREAEPAGVAFYRNVWQTDGGPDNVVANIISSAEFFASAGGTNALWVTELYRRLLGREPDAAGLDYWTTRLTSGQLSRQQVVFGFTRSDENFRNLITGWYQQYLGRHPTADELGARVQRMRAGATQRAIQIELIDSPEYRLTP